MARKFDEQFSEPKQFTPDGLHLSRREYSRAEAAEKFQQCLDEYIFVDADNPPTVDPDELRKSWVRWGFQNWSPDLPSPCWLVCSKDDHAAQPTWELL